MKIIDVQVQTFTREPMKYQPNLEEIEAAIYISPKKLDRAIRYF
jgi:hypothetical protein